MSNVILYTLLTFLFLIFFVLLTWLAIVYFNKEKEIIDNPLMLNFCSSLDSGRFLGEVKKIETAKGGRHYITLAPKDIDTRITKELDDVNVIIDKDKLISLPKGGVSKEKNIMVGLPPKAELLTPALKDTLIGKAIMWATEMDNYAKTQVEILREGINRRDDLHKEIGTGEASNKFLEFTKDLTLDWMENMINKNEKNKNIISPPIQHTSSNE